MDDNELMSAVRNAVFSGASGTEEQAEARRQLSETRRLIEIFKTSRAEMRLQTP